MTAAYLWFNCIAYVLLGLWCAASVDKTASAVGFKALSASGRCEYTAVYGGLQIALGVLFGLTASRPEMLPLGILFALVIYAGIVPFRLIGLLRFWPVTPATRVFAGFEVLMLVFAIGLRMSGPA